MDLTAMSDSLAFQKNVGRYCVHCCLTSPNMASSVFMVVPLCLVSVVFGRAEFIILNVKIKSLMCTKCWDVSSSTILTSVIFFFSHLVSWSSLSLSSSFTKKSKNPNGGMWEFIICDHTAYRHKTIRALAMVWGNIVFCRGQVTRCTINALFR